MCFVASIPFAVELLENNPEHYKHLESLNTINTNRGTQTLAIHQYLVEKFLRRYEISPEVLLRLLTNGSEVSGEIIDALWYKVLEFADLLYKNIMPVRDFTVIQNYAPTRTQLLMNELLDLVETPPETIEYDLWKSMTSSSED